MTVELATFATDLDHPFCSAEPEHQLETNVLGAGATGYIAVQLVKQLLEKGYVVRGTVRSTKDTAKTQILTQLGDVLPGVRPCSM